MIWQGQTRGSGLLLLLFVSNKQKTKQIPAISPGTRPCKGGWAGPGAGRFLGRNCFPPEKSRTEFKGGDFKTVLTFCSAAMEELFSEGRFCAWKQIEIKIIHSGEKNLYLAFFVIVPIVNIFIFVLNLYFTKFLKSWKCCCLLMKTSKVKRIEWSRASISASRLGLSISENEMSGPSWFHNISENNLFSSSNTYMHLISETFLLVLWGLR